MGAYSAAPDPLAGFKGAALRQEGNRGDGRTRGGGEGKGGEMGGMEKGGEKVEVGEGNSALVVGGRHP